MTTLPEEDVYEFSELDIMQKQQKELNASMRYASNIQSALLPSELLISKITSQHFILFKPKDIISGDFYWIYKKSNMHIIAVVDCTGHGVPGAFMSILGLSFLNEIVARDIRISASGILNMLRERVMKALHQTGGFEEQKDGMDISLCVVNVDTGEMQFAGANNPIYIVRDGLLTEIKGDRMPIGINATEEKSFTNHHFQLQKEDKIYLFSDGFADQFGGPTGKKIKYGPFKNLICRISKYPMNKQKDELIKFLKNWQGHIPQIDDILVFGCIPFN